MISVLFIPIAAGEVAELSCPIRALYLARTEVTYREAVRNVVQDIEGVYSMNQGFI